MEPEGRKLTDEEYRMYIQNTDRSFITRAVQMRGLPTDQQSADFTQTGGPSSGKKRGDISLPMIRPEETSLMNCTIVGDHATAEKVWAEACTIVQDLNNVDPMILQNWKAIGNYYQHGSFCEFLMALYQNRESNQHVLDFKRMSGDGFVMDAFFRQMKEPLDGTGMTMNPGTEVDGETDDDDDDMDMFDDYSSDEDEDETDVDEEFLRPGGYLKMSADKKLVVHWMNQVQTRHIEDQNHMMGLMAHNSELEENRAIMLEHLPDMLKMIIQKLSQTTNAALVRNASVLLHNLLLDVKALPADQTNDLRQAIFKAMQKWCPQEFVGSHLKPVSQSRETVKYLSMAVASLLRNKLFTSEEMNSSRDLLGDTLLPVVNCLQFLSVQSGKLPEDTAKVQGPRLSEALNFFAVTT